MGRNTIIITEDIYGKAKSIFDSVNDMHVIIAPSEENTLSESIRFHNPFAVVIGTVKYFDNLYKSLGEGGIIARFGVGCDGINFEEVKRNKLLVINTPGTLDSTVAEFTVFLAAEILRRIGTISDNMKNGVWSPSIGNDLSGKTWGIIGMGNIGKQLSKILSFGFGVRVFGLEQAKLDSYKMKKQFGVERLFSNYSDFVVNLDIVSLHLPGNSQTFHFLNRDRLNKLKDGTILINTGRGSLIDEEALYDILANHKIKGAALDVFESEPYQSQSPDLDFRKLPNVLLTPHIASGTIECCERMALSIVSDLRKALQSNYEQMHLVN